MVALSEFRKNNTTLGLLEDQHDIADLRPYLGCSSLGHDCERYLWFSFRWCFQEKINARLRRLFKRGHREEPEIIEELERIGIKCSGDQTEVVTGYGHVKGHCDGIAENVPEAPKTPHLLEFKTMSDKYFKEMWTKGCKVSKRTYWVQCQLYMYLLKLKRTLFVCVNKNDDSYYVERIKLDTDVAQHYLKRANDILLSEFPPAVKPPHKVSWYKCKWCAAREVCFHGVAIHETCRTCDKVEIHDDGVWRCAKQEKELTTDEQRTPCKHYNQIQL